MQNFCNNVGKYLVGLVVYLFQLVITLVRWCPDSVADCFFSLFRLVLLSLLGVSSFIRRFNNGECTYISMGIASLVWYVHKKRTTNQAKNKKAECMRKQNASLEAELTQQQQLCSTLENVKKALADKNKIEKIASMEKQSIEQELHNFKKSYKTQKCELEELRTCNQDLKQDLEARKLEATKLRAEFKTKLDKFEGAVTDVKTLENERNALRVQLTDVRKKLQERNELVNSLKSAVELLTNQRAQLMEKYKDAITTLGTVKGENKKLERTLTNQKSQRRQDSRKIGEIDQLTQKLQESLSSAKGRLSRVGGRLADNPQANTTQLNSRATTQVNSPKSVQLF